MNTTTIGLDIAKRLFQAHGAFGLYTTVPVQIHPYPEFRARAGAPGQYLCAVRAATNPWRLEDLAAQMGNEASSHRAREPQAGVMVVNANIAAVTLANKNARIIWALLAHEREYQAGYF